MDIIDHESNEKTYTNYMKYEHGITKTGWIIFVFLILEDVLVDYLWLNNLLI